MLCAVSVAGQSLVRRHRGEGHPMLVAVLQVQSVQQRLDSAHQQAAMLPGVVSACCVLFIIDICMSPLYRMST